MACTTYRTARKRACYARSACHVLSELMIREAMRPLVERIEAACATFGNITGCR
jgi:hypothetical protein